jgi:cbb3-type cytochrome oxidase maturation protein
MLAILMLLALALAMGLGFLGLFIHAARRGQFDDLEDPPKRMLQD